MKTEQIMPLCTAGVCNTETMEAAIEIADNLIEGIDTEKQVKELILKYPQQYREKILEDFWYYWEDSCFSGGSW